MAKSKYEKLVDLFIESDELGHYDPEKYSICLYGIENTPKVLNGIKSRIEKITKKFSFVVLDKKEKFTNINILDIEL